MKLTKMRMRYHKALLPNSLKTVSLNDRTASLDMFLRTLKLKYKISQEGKS